MTRPAGPPSRQGRRWDTERRRRTCALRSRPVRACYDFPMPRVSAKAASFTESVIREMTRLAQRHGAVNLSQGFPDFACPPELKEAAKRAIDADLNQYAITWG